MITIPLTWFAIAYFALVVFLLIFYFMVLYQLIHTGTFTLISFVVTGIVTGAMIFVLITTWTYGASIDWSDSVTLFGNGQSSPDLF